MNLLRLSLDVEEKTKELVIKPRLLALFVLMAGSLAVRKPGTGSSADPIVTKPALAQESPPWPIFRQSLKESQSLKKS